MGNSDHKLRHRTIDSGHEGSLWVCSSLSASLVPCSLLSFVLITHWLCLHYIAQVSPHCLYTKICRIKASNKGFFYVHVRIPPASAAGDEVKTLLPLHNATLNLQRTIHKSSFLHYSSCCNCCGKLVDNLCVPS